MQLSTPRAVEGFNDVLLEYFQIIFKQKISKKCFHNLFAIVLRKKQINHTPTVSDILLLKYTTIGYHLPPI